MITTEKTNIKEMFFYTKWITFYKSFDVHFATDRPKPLSKVIEVTSEEVVAKRCYGPMLASHNIS